jgi:ATP-dependent exoDNAse (exonuclease V) alpha subunit
MGRIREVQDTAERHASIAGEYVTAHAADERALVVSPANEERRQLNRVIRQRLQERGLVDAREVAHAILVNRDLTRPQRNQARNYNVGDIVRFARGSRKIGIKKGAHAVVEHVNSDAGRLSVVFNDGKRFEYSPKRLSGVEVFRTEQRKFSAGDRIQFRAPEHTLGIANGEFATIVAVDERTARIRTENGREIASSIERLRHIDYGYASTSHSSQGATVDRVIVNIDTMRSAELVNRKQFYVSISRARHDLSIYTDDRVRLGQAVGRSREKSMALQQVHWHSLAVLRVAAEQNLHRRRQSHGLRR